MSAAFTGSEAVCIKGVSNIPGSTAFTLIPSLAKSRATGTVKPTMPLLEAAYAACPTCPYSAATLAVLIMTPRSPSGSGSKLSIPLADFTMHLNVPIKFT